MAQYTKLQISSNNKISSKKVDEMLDIDAILRNIKVSSSEYTRMFGDKPFPNDCQSCKFPRIQHSTSVLFRPAIVPLAMQNKQWKKNGREKDRLTTNFFDCWSLLQLRFLSFLNNSVKNSHS